ncbi:MAG TPA: hypothetical protein VGO47_06210 [Chlamydiales bacterium]|jgi:hypothetical protein|nr:hypothetical protein [Chlamydiales bacterium]
MGKTKVEIGVPMLVGDKEKLQQQLHETIAQIESKLAELEGTKTVGKGTVAVITSIFLDQYNPSYGGVIQSLPSEQSLPLLINGLARIRAAKREYEEAAESVGLKKYPAFVWSGVSGDNIINQLEQRIKLVSNSNIITQLKAEKKKLETFLSEEDRLAATLSSLSSLLKDN